jgi:hypothetical protein
MSAGYRFLSWVRDGLAAGGTVSDPGSGDLPVRNTVGVQVELTVESQESQESPESIFTGVDLQLIGPGDVIGIDPAQIIRTEPRPGTTGFAPNYFAFIEFDRPDFPWIFTPASAGERNRLRPWLFLVVVPDDHDGVQFGSHSPGSLPTLTCPLAELPDLSESWAWAHAQVALQSDSETVLTVLQNHPDRTLSRIICPRRLQENTRYLACLVPAFEAGRQAGLGGNDPSKQAGPAWSAANSEVTLPVYYHWRFATGQEGDFEALVSRLRRREMPAEESYLPIYVGAADPGLPARQPEEAGAVLGMEGALRSPEALSAPWPWPEPARTEFQSAMETILTPADDRLSPPVYGATHAGLDRLPAQDKTPHWLRELNLDPRHRAAAALGVRVIQQHQEALVTAAWQHAAELQRVNQIRAVGEAAQAVQAASYEQRLPPPAVQELKTLTAGTKRLSFGRMLQLARPLLSRVRARPLLSRVTGTAADTETIADVLAKRPAAATATSPAFRRVARPLGPVARRLGTSGALLQEPVKELAEGNLAAVPDLQSPESMVKFDDLSETKDSIKLNEITPEFVRNVAPWWEDAAAEAVAQAAVLTMMNPTRVISPPGPMTSWGTWFVTVQDLSTLSRKLFELAWSGSRWLWFDHGAPERTEVGLAAPVPFGSERRVFVISEYGDMLERYYDGDMWQWRRHERPPDGSGIKFAPGPVLGDGIFVTTMKNRWPDPTLLGQLWELRRTEMDNWEWVYHGAPEIPPNFPPDHGIDTRPIGAISQARLWVGTKAGYLFQRRWTGSEWIWFYHGFPGFSTPEQSSLVAEVGPPLTDTQIFVRGRDGNLWEYRVENGLWNWYMHGNPGVALEAGPWAVVSANESPTGEDTVYVTGIDGNVYRRLKGRVSLPTPVPDPDPQLSTMETASSMKGWFWKRLEFATDTKAQSGSMFPHRGPLVLTSAGELALYRYQSGVGFGWETLPQPMDSRGSGWSYQAPPKDTKRWAPPLGFMSNLLVAHVDNPGGENSIHTRLGKNMDFDAQVRGSWTSPTKILPPPNESIGTETQGLGIAVVRRQTGTNTEAHDLVVLYVDNPGGPNTLYYRIGWNMNAEGIPTSWSPRKQVPFPVADVVQGADIAVGDLDGDGRPELLVLYATASYPRSRLFYRIGWGLDETGDVVNGWSFHELTPSGDHGGLYVETVQSVGVAMVDMNKDGMPDLVMLTLESRAEGSVLNYWIGRQLNGRGNVLGGWNGHLISAGPPGSIFQGAGVAVADFSGTERPDLVIFTIENREGENLAQWRIGRDLDEDGRVQTWIGPHTIPGWFGWENAGAAIAVADVNPVLKAERGRMGRRFQDAAEAHQQVVAAVAELPELETPNVDELAALAYVALEPAALITSRTQSRVSLGTRSLPEDNLHPLATTPVFRQPMYRALAELAPAYFFPGGTAVAPETVSLVHSNPTFIEAFMVGLNHEFARELLWRGFPADRRGTYFRYFWDVGAVADPTPDIPPITTWKPDARLGDTAADEGAANKLVLVVRSELMRRFPTTVIYAQKAEWDGTRRVLGTKKLAPLFYGRLEPDLLLFGLPLNSEQAAGTGDDAGWFIVFQQPPTEPRFGLDEAKEVADYGASTLANWSELHWGHLVSSEEKLKKLGYIRLSEQEDWMKWMDARWPLRAGSHTRKEAWAEWGYNAAHMAQILFQPPVRFAIHATDLLPGDDQ